jgi:hypothetical protein
VRKQAAEIVAAFDSVPMDFAGSEPAWGFAGGRDPQHLAEEAREDRAAWWQALADTSVYVRQAEVRGRFESLLVAGRLAVCEMVALEVPQQRPGSKRLRDPVGACMVSGGSRSTRVRSTFTARSQREASSSGEPAAAGSQQQRFRLLGLIIAATAEVHGATVPHDDADYDRIAAVTGQPVEWAAAKGSLR